MSKELDKFNSNTGITSKEANESLCKLYGHVIPADNPTCQFQPCERCGALIDQNGSEIPF